MNIVVVGGGTAGWLTALYAKKVNTTDNVILIESDEYGILGAGEGSTPHLIEFLDYLGISVVELIQNCKSTIKNGIKFTNWSNKNDHYYHAFLSQHKASNDYNFPLYSDFIEKDSLFSHQCAALDNKEMKDYVFMQKISDNFSVPFIKKDNNFEQIARWSIHFDANTLAKYLRNLGESRGIIRKEGIVNEIKTDVSGYINQLITEKEIIDSDFVFDCSGFRRVIIGNYYKSEWKSHSEYLPAKKAIPFFLSQDEKIPPYTESIAMNYGWMWKIPLQHRYGCGYVFDSNFISEDKAKEELDNFFGFEVESPKTFSFSAGCYKSIWINNCLAVGLSSGFIEPLEATSIMQSIEVLKRFLSSEENLTTKNIYIKEKFNSMYVKETQEIVDFIYLHYVTNKNNTIFWTDFLANNKTPEFIKYILNTYKSKNFYDSFDFDEKTFFKSYGYMYVMMGNGVIDKNIIINNIKFLSNNKKEKYKEIINFQDQVVSSCVSHNNFISYILSNERKI